MMQRKPLLSVIVPVYNAGAFLQRCVDSLIRQTYENMEIILVDDGSKDESPRICDAYAEKNEKIRVLHKENAGAGFARNSGLEMAKGEWIAFCDSDDYADETMYAKLMEETDKGTVDAVFCDFFIQKYDGSLKPAHSAIPAGEYTGREILLNMLGAPPEAAHDSAFDVSVWKGVYSKQLIDSCAIRFSSERNMISEDLRFHIDFLPKANSVIYIKDKLYRYCEIDGSLTHKYMENRLPQEKLLFFTVSNLAADILQGDEMLRWERLFLGRVRSTIGQYVYYTNGYTFHKRICEIRAIANDDLVQRVIRHYPIQKNPVKLRIFNTFLKWKFSMGMYVLLALNR